MRHRKLDAPYRLPTVFFVLSVISAVRFPPVLSPWSIPTGGHAPWPPQHTSKPTAAMPRGAPGRKPRGEGPRTAQRLHTRHDRPHYLARPAPGRPKELEDRTQQAIAAMKPRNPLELDLVCRAVRLAGKSTSPERVATAHLAHRVRMATRSGTDTVMRKSSARFTTSAASCFFRPR